MRIPTIRSLNSIINHELNRPFQEHIASTNSFLNLAMNLTHAYLFTKRLQKKDFNSLKSYTWVILPATLAFYFWDNRRINNSLGISPYIDLRTAIYNPLFFILNAIDVTRTGLPVRPSNRLGTSLFLSSLSRKLIASNFSSEISHKIEAIRNLFSAARAISDVTLGFSALVKRLYLEETLAHQTQEPCIRFSLPDPFLKNLKNLKSMFKDLKSFQNEDVKTRAERALVESKIKKLMVEIEKAHGKTDKVIESEISIQNFFKEMKNYYSLLFKEELSLGFTYTSKEEIFEGYRKKEIKLLQEFLEELRAFQKKPFENHQMKPPAIYERVLLESKKENLEKVIIEILKGNINTFSDNINRELLNRKRGLLNFKLFALSFLKLEHVKKDDNTKFKLEISRAINQDGLRGQTLDLSNFGLTRVPPIVFEIDKLRFLHLSRNPLIGDTSLPESLPVSSAIEEILVSGTAITEKAKDDLLAPLKAKRYKEYLDEVSSPVLKRWKSYNSHRAGSFNFINSLDDEKKTIITDWLLRAEGIVAFSGSEKLNIANMIADVLDTASSYPDFLEIFLAQAAANNADCGERAGMALNDVYTCWKIYTLAQSNASFEEKIKVCISAAKTFTLRSCLAKWIHENIPNVKNTAEIYFYYELTLQKPLNSLTFLKSSGESSHSIGKRSEINDKDLAQTVNATYLDSLFSISVFENILLGNPCFQALWSPKEDFFYEKQEELAEKKSSEEITQLEYEEKSLEVQHGLINAKKNCTIEFLRGKGWIF
jgi:hypothetical protein